MRHHIFLSYSRQNAAIMQRLRDDFRATGLMVWTDEGIDPGSASWKIEIEEAIRGADCIVVIFSPSAIQSRWVRAELDYAEAQKKPIFAVLAEGDESNAVPFGYSSHQWIDLRNPTYYDSNFQRLIKTITNSFNKTDTTKNQLPPAPVHTSLKSRRWLWALTALALLLVIAAVIIVNNRAAPSLHVEATNIQSVQSINTVSPTESLQHITAEAVVIPAYTSPTQWVNHETDLFHISAPANWINTSPDSEVFTVLAQNIIPSYDAQSGITQLPDSEIYFYIGDFLNLQGLFVIREEINLSLSLSVLSLRYQDFIRAFSYEVSTVENVVLPAGEAVHITVDTSDGITPGIGHIYILTHGQNSFFFLFAGAETVDEQAFIEISQRIISTLSFNT